MASRHLLFRQFGHDWLLPVCVRLAKSFNHAAIAAENGILKNFVKNSFHHIPVENQPSVFLKNLVVKPYLGSLGYCVGGFSEHAVVGVQNFSHIPGAQRTCKNNGHKNRTPLTLGNILKNLYARVRAVFHILPEPGVQFSGVISKAFLRTHLSGR